MSQRPTGGTPSAHPLSEAPATAAANAQRAAATPTNRPNGAGAAAPSGPNGLPPAHPNTAAPAPATQNGVPRPRPNAAAVTAALSRLTGSPPLPHPTVATAAGPGRPNGAAPPPHPTTTAAAAPPHARANGAPPSTSTAAAATAGGSSRANGALPSTSTAAAAIAGGPSRANGAVAAAVAQAALQGLNRANGAAAGPSTSSGGGAAAPSRANGAAGPSTLPGPQTRPQGGAGPSAAAPGGQNRPHGAGAPGPSSSGGPGGQIRPHGAGAPGPSSSAGNGAAAVAGVPANTVTAATARAAAALRAAQAQQHAPDPMADATAARLLTDLRMALPKKDKVGATSMRFLTTLIFESEQARLKVVEAGALQPIVGLLASRSGKVREWATAILTALTHSAAAQYQAALNGAVVGLAALLQSGTTAGKNLAASALASICWADVRGMVQMGVLPTLIEMLSCGNPRNEKSAAEALAVLSFTSEVAKEIAILPGAIAAIMRALQAGHPRVRRPALEALSRLATRETSVVPFDECGVVAAIAHVLERSNNKKRRQLAFRAANSTIIAQYGTATPFRASHFAALLASLNLGGAETAQASFLLRKLTVDSPRHAALVTSHPGWAERLLGVVMNIGVCGDASRYATGALRNLSIASPANAANIVEAGGIDALFTQIRRGKERTQAAAAGCLRTLARGDHATRRAIATPQGLALLAKVATTGVKSDAGKVRTLALLRVLKRTPGLSGRILESLPLATCAEAGLLYNQAVVHEYVKLPPRPIQAPQAAAQAAAAAAQAAAAAAVQAAAAQAGGAPAVPQALPPVIAHALADAAQAMPAAARGAQPAPRPGPPARG